MTADADDRVARLERRLQRERRIRDQAEMISERATRELYEQQRGLVLLRAVTDAVNDATSLDDAISAALEVVREHNGWTLGHAWLLDETEQMVSTSLWCGATERFADFRAITGELAGAAATGLPGRVLAERRPVWLADATLVPWIPRAQAATAAGLRAALGVPIMVGADVVGVLELFSERELEPSPALLGLMSQVGTQLGRASERHAADTLLRLATHDTLTGLPNRALLLDHLRRALSRRSRRPGEHVAVLFLDLDGFKAVNDAVGHATGDDVLRRVAERLQAVVRPHDAFGRLGGDEFVLVCELLESHTVAGVAERLIEVLARPFEADRKQFRITASVGIAIAAADSAPEDLIGQADAAMYRAKEQGRGRYEVFSAELRAEIERRLDLHEGLRHAIEREELHLVYQPEVDLTTGRVVGLEALLRWRRPGGIVMPVDFVPLAEETGLIVPIGAWVLHEALRRRRAWEAAGTLAREPWIAVNLSLRQLADPELLGHVAEAVRAGGGGDGSGLVLEVTESVVLHDTAAGMALLRALRGLGAQIAIDDFGTGYASLSYLREFPASILKVDRSFISVLHEPQTRAIVRAVIEMAHALGLSVVAEGIETAQQLRALCALGCDVGQGYYLARPQPPDDLEHLLRDGQPFARQVREARADVPV